MEESKLTRRTFLKSLTTAIIAAPLLLLSKKLFSADIKKLPSGLKALEESAPLAKALHYKSDATQVSNPKFKAGQSCSNCTQYIKKNDEWGECKVIKQVAVAGTGWCTSYVEKKTPV